MAYIDETSAYGVLNNVANAHQVHYKFSVYGFPHTESLLFTRNYETDCQKLPTSWNIEIWFQRACSSGTISCNLKVKRIDLSINTVRVCPTMTFYSARHAQMAKFLNFLFMEVASGQEVQREADPVLTDGEINSLFDQDLKVRFTLEVANCHQVIPKHDPISKRVSRYDHPSLVE